MNRSYQKLMFFLLILLIPLFVFSCNSSDDANGKESGRETSDDDDDYPFPDDDSTDDDSNDDTSDDDSDDDDTTGPSIEILRPEENAVLPTQTVLIHGEYQYLNKNDITICERIDAGTCTDYTSQFIFNDTDKYFTSSIVLSKGKHTFEATGLYAKAEQVTDSVTFTVDDGGLRLELELSETSINAGDTITATVTVYDDDENDVTSSCTIYYYLDPQTGVVQNGNQFTFNQGGRFEIEATTVYASKALSDVKYVYVQEADAFSIDVVLSESTIQAGESVTATATILDSNSNPIYGNVFYNVSPPFGVAMDPNNGNGPTVNIDFTKSGMFEITGTLIGTNLSDTETLEVTPGIPNLMLLTLPSTEIFIPSGRSVTIEPIVEIWDAHGNLLSDEPYTLDVQGGTGYTIDQVNKTITFDDNAGAGGLYLILAHCDNYPSVADSESLIVEAANDVDIVFTYPPRGFTTTDSFVDVEGYVIDCDLLDHLLKVNDTWVSMNSSCEFSYNVSLTEGLNIVSARVIDDDTLETIARGSTSILKGNFYADDSFIPDSIWLGLTEAGFTKMGDIVNELIDDMDIPGMIMSMNPVFDEEYDLWGVTLASAEAEVTDVTMGDLTIDFDIAADDNYLSTTLRLNDIRLDFDVSGSILGIGYSIDGDVSTDYVEVFANTGIGISGGTLYADVDTISVDIATLDIDINNFPDDLEDMFEDDISDLIEDVVSDALQSEVPAILNDLISQLPTDYTFPITLPNSGTVNVNVAMEPTQVSTNVNGDAFTFVMDSRIMMDEVSGIPPTLPGSFATPSAAPDSFGAYILGTSNPYELAIYIGDDIFNQALYNIFRAGALSLNLDAVFYNDDILAIPLLPSELRDQVTYPHSPINIKFRPMLPPMMLIGVGDKSDPVSTSIQMGDLIVDCYIVNTSAEEELFLEMAMSFTVDVDIDIPFPSNTLVVTIGTPDVQMDIVAEPIADFNDVVLEALAPYLVELVLPIISDLLQGIEIPTFSGYGIQVLQMFVTGSGSDYISIWTELITP